MNKHNLRSKSLNLRKKNFNKNFKISLIIFYSFLKNNNYTFKNVGGYFPSNYEIDDLKILKFLEKKKF